jgi:hypothetical protein
MHRVDTRKPHREKQQRGNGTQESEPLDRPPTTMQEMEKRRNGCRVDLMHPKAMASSSGRGEKDVCAVLT